MSVLNVYFLSLLWIEANMHSMLLVTYHSPTRTMDCRKQRSITSNDDEDAKSILHKEWDESSCPICMDHPHNAVLLVCSSHDKGCRSYICDTSYRHSNCLDRFKNPGDKEPGLDLKCPLCRGSVLSWKVVEEARKYLNLKPRACSRESCLYSGNYKELRGHARRVHPAARPADIDPSRKRAWHLLEDQREYNDILSAISSAVPGAVVIGDHVIESGGGHWEQDHHLRGGGGEGGARLLSTLVLFQMWGSLDSGGGGRSRGVQRSIRGGGGGGGAASSRRRYLWGENLLGVRDDEEEEEGGGEGNGDDDGDDDDDDDDVDLNMLSDIGPPRRRRRILMPDRFLAGDNDEEYMGF